MHILVCFVVKNKSNSFKIETALKEWQFLLNKGTISPSMLEKRKTKNKNTVQCDMGYEASKHIFVCCVGL
jgi:hypothetical protein